MQVLLPFAPRSQSFNQLQEYLKHCALFGLKGPVHDLVLVIPPHPFVTVACNSSACSKHEGLCMTMYVWLCRAMEGCVWVCRAM